MNAATRHQNRPRQRNPGHPERRLVLAFAAALLTTSISACGSDAVSPAPPSSRDPQPTALSTPLTLPAATSSPQPTVAEVRLLALMNRAYHGGCSPKPL